MRDSRGKARQMSTFNGRTVVIKESSVFSNKGFKTFNQAQLLSDMLYYHPSATGTSSSTNSNSNSNSSNAGGSTKTGSGSGSTTALDHPWLIYHISKPLLGTYEPARIVPAVVPPSEPVERPPLAVLPPHQPLPAGSTLSASATALFGGHSHVHAQAVKKDIKSFAELLTDFPMIARQMEPGLARILAEFEKEVGAKPLPPRPSDVEEHQQHEVATEEDTRAEENQAPATTTISPPPPLCPTNTPQDDVDLMRGALETAVSAAIDLFRAVDKQQLSLLGATTNLSGTLVERLIERHVAGAVHARTVFPRLCAWHRAEDRELDAHIRQMEHLDVSQVGIATEDGRAGKRDLIRRVDRGVAEFRRIADPAVADCPAAMADALLATIKAVSLDEEDAAVAAAAAEKRPHVVTVNADVLVSLLLMVIVRAQVRHLMSRHVYMHQFIFCDDVDNGEIGYGLSTMEVVLTYLLRDSTALRKASARNNRLWRATKDGRVDDMRAILESEEEEEEEDEYSGRLTGQAGDGETGADGGSDDTSREESRRMYGLSFENLKRNDLALQRHAEIENKQHQTQQQQHTNSGEGLSHVFPFLAWSQYSQQQPHPWPSGSSGNNKQAKRVSMDLRSLSETSSTSALSRATTVGSSLDAVNGDMSIENLTKTQDPNGCSIPMMAVEASQSASLAYLLSLTQYYPLDSILEDTNNYGTTLLSAAIQLGNAELIDILLNYLSRCTDKSVLRAYYAKADAHGRTMAHYLFSAPRLLSRLGLDLPWTQRDRNGQTPLFALCRSYDHPHYAAMVTEALAVARAAQSDNQPLRLDDHIDSRGNTLLHIVSDPAVLARILADCDCDPNATNDRRFTPLMMASKYGRVDLVRVLFNDPRVDIGLREARGLTAIELAKDDDVRNRIDDLVLFSNSPPNPADPSRRITTVVRSLFVEDASVRFIIKSGAPIMTQRRGRGRQHALPQQQSPTYTVTTCRRSLADFENLLQFLRIEHPASYIPDGPTYPSPFQIPSKPSRAVQHELQDHLDLLLKTLLVHPTFGLHEMLWEFFLVPEMETEMIRERSQRKAAVLTETIADDYRPVTKDGVREIEQVVSYTQEAVDALHAASSTLIERGFALHYAACDVSDSLALLTQSLATLQAPTHALPSAYVEVFARFAAHQSASNVDSSPLMRFLTSLLALNRATAAVQTSLQRPVSLVAQLDASTRTLTRLHSQLASSTMPRKFSFLVLEESRARNARELEAKVLTLTHEIEQLSKEISWNKDVLVGELAGWTSWREVVGRQALRKYVQSSLVRERERGRRLDRCLRSLREVKRRHGGALTLGL
ncbi:hypothetical protein KEM52_004583 [Ascosphaera acerosa]|nr:hypothetical protein KEM52_004583 [Ascosphaera acerosa]